MARLPSLPLKIAASACLLASVQSAFAGSFTFESAVDNGSTVTQTRDGVTVTATSSSGAGVTVMNLGGQAGSSATVLIADNSASTASNLSLSFSQSIDISDLRAFDANSSTTTNWTFTPNTGSAVVTTVDGSSGTTPSLNFSGITGLTITSDSPVNYALDNIQFEITPDADGNLTAASGVIEPVDLSSTVASSGSAVDLFDFTLSDGGGGDGETLNVSQIKIQVGGSASDSQRGKITWRLNGPDVTNVTGTYHASDDSITFSGLSLSIADGGSEVYTVNGYFNDNSGVSDGATIQLSVDGDTDLTVGSGTQMGSTSVVSSGSGTILDVVATQLVFTQQPAGSVSGNTLSTQPVVTARDNFGNTDVDFAESITLTESSAGSLGGTKAVSATSGVATFTDVSYTATADQQSFNLTANDQNDLGSDLPAVTSNAVISDVVATKLVFDTQPAPLSVASGVNTPFTTVPVILAQDSNNVTDSGYSTGITLAEVNGAGSALLSADNDTDGSTATVTRTPNSGETTFSGLQITYNASGTTDETFNLRASSGTLSSATSAQFTSDAINSDASLTAASGVSEPVALSYSRDTVSEAINLFDFTLSDGGSGDEKALEISEIRVQVGGSSSDSERGKLTWRLNGSDVSQKAGSYSAATNTLTFSGLTISVADGTSETYTLNAYFNDTSGITSGNTVTLSIDGDTDVSVSSSGTQMGSTSPVTNGDGTILTDNVNPSIISVSLPANGTYAEGSALNFTVNFDENVIVTGSPRLTLTVGSTTRYANYQAGSGTTALTFRYTVASGEIDSDGITLANTISANGGTLRDGQGNSAGLSLGSPGSLASVKVDGQAPVISIGSEIPPLGNDPTPGLQVTSNESGTLDIGGSCGSPSEGAFSSGTRSITITKADSAVALDPGTYSDCTVLLTDAAGNESNLINLASFTIDTSAPTVVSSELLGNPAGGVSSVQYEVTFSESISNISADDFSVTSIGDASGAVLSVSSSSGSKVTVTVGNLAGKGSIRLDVKSGTNATDAAGNSVAAYSSGDTHTVDREGPVITGVSLPDRVHKVGDSVTATITVASDPDDFSTGSGGLSGTINGYTLTNFTKLSNTSYSARFTVSNGGTNRSAASSIPLDLTITDSQGNLSNNYTQAVSQSNDPIYAQLPLVSLTSNRSTISENGGTASLTASLGNSLNNQWPESIQVALVYSGTATAGADYSKVDSINIPANNSSASTTITAIADTDSAEDSVETVIIDISAVSTGSENGTQRVTISIGDNDTDGDGMDNDYETENGLDPNDPSDAEGDLDGDGVSNLDEYNNQTDPTVDDYGPVITVRESVVIDATGLLTPLPDNLASATDGLDGAVPVSSDLAQDRLPPGRHVITWTAADSAGNISSAAQTIDIRPLANWQLDQEAGEGSTVTVTLFLNGDAPEYPVRASYTVGGTATNPEDHDAENGIIIIPEGRSASISVNIVDDDNGEVDETIEFSLLIVENAAEGTNTLHEVTISESNHRPRVVLKATLEESPAQPRTFFTPGQGEVTVTATVSDIDAGDEHQLNWLDLDGLGGNPMGETYTFDASQVAAGTYQLFVEATDDAAQPLTGMALITLTVAREDIRLNGLLDSDGDGLSDLEEGLTDSDGDNVPDFADSVDASNLLAIYPTGGAPVAGAWFVETQPGLRLKLNQYASGSARFSPALTKEDVVTNSGVSLEDEGYIYDGGIFDFVVSDMPTPGQTIAVVLPQIAPVPEDAVYRKLTGSDWQDFVEDGNNLVSSAPGLEGACPPPGSSEYQPGLAEGDFCVQLQIEDGGPNDADGEANSIVLDPGGVGASTVRTVNSRPGGGALNPWALLALLFLILGRHSKLSQARNRA